MTKEQEALKNTVSLFTLMQVMITKIEDFEHPQEVFIQELKYLTNKQKKTLLPYKNYLERRLEPFYKNLDKDTNDTMNELSMEIEKVFDSIKFD